MKKIKKLLLIIFLFTSSSIFAQRTITVENNTDCAIYYELSISKANPVCDFLISPTYFIGGHSSISHTTPNPDEIYTLITLAGPPFGKSCISHAVAGIQFSEYEQCTTCPYQSVPQQSQSQTCMNCQPQITVQWDFYNCLDGKVTIY